MTKHFSDISILNKFDVAKEYAQAGFNIIPVKQKTPCIKGWKSTASCDLDVIEQWWTQHPDAEPSLLLSSSGIAVLDFDNAKQGKRRWEDALSELEKLTGVDLSDHPYVVETKNKGRHYYFNLPEGHNLKTQVKCFGIDGFDLLAGDRHVVLANSNTYKLLNDKNGYNPETLKSLPELPREILKALTSDSKAYGLSALREECLSLSNTTEGSRNDQLFKASAKIGELIAGEQLDQSLAKSWIIRACECNGLVSDGGMGSVINTLESGLAKGKESPRQAADNAYSGKDVEVPKHLKDKGLKFDCTELGNKDRFIEQYGDKVRFIGELKRWVVWDGSRWTPSNQSRVHDMVTQTVKSIYIEARDCENDEGRKQLTSWALRSQNHKQINSILSLAAQDPKVNVSIQSFDTDPRKVSCRNGILDLATGEIVGATPDDLIMQQLSVSYNPNAKCPRWDQFIREVFLGDAELMRYVQRILGYALTGLTSEQCLFLAYGLGANGKSTLFETVLDIMGDYGGTMEFSTLLNTSQTSVRTQEAIGKLKDKRYVIASETDSTKRFSEALVKKITGSDTLTGAALYGQSYDFRPTHKIFLQVNHKPGVKDASHGFWRRMRVIPFLKKFSDREKDTGLCETLAKEKEGIFAWLVRGATAYLKDRFGDEPKVVTEATEAYKDENDILSKFIRECLVSEYGASVSVSDTYDAYKQWCYSNKVDVTPMQYFSSGMEEREIVKKKTNKSNVFSNLTLRSPEDAPF